MSEKITAENLLNTLVETLTEKQKSGSFFEEDKSSSVSYQFNRLFGRQKPVHHILGGGKSADVLLWRNKKISASVLSAATAIWVLFEWLNYNFITILFFVVALGMLGQFLWTNVSGLFSRKPSKVPRFVLPDDIFVNIATVVGAEVNRGLRFLQDVSCGGSLKQFLIVVVSLWAGAVIGSWCNFLTVMYIGVLLLHIHSQFSMKGMRIKLTTLCTRSLIRCKITIRSWILVCSAKSPRESSKERSMNRLFLL
ncbi:hypothetical protein JHK86_005651 [Glycine max]|nr:hypothetical protein JHK86_005651 [Glycine max]